MNLIKFKNTDKTPSRGFTLLEVMISLAILMTLGIMAGQAISQGIKAKKRIQEQIDDVSRMRDAVRLMERDIELAYHHVDWELELNELIKKKATQNQKQNTQQPGLPPLPPVDPSQTPLQNQQNPFLNEPKPEVERISPDTHFVGSSEELSFVTMNQTRLGRDLNQADFVEVGYTVTECKSLDGMQSSKCLWRRTFNVVDKDPTKGGDPEVLLENITEFKLRYLGEGKQDWVEEWKTNSSDDANIKGKFPLGVEISIAIQKKHENEKSKSKKYSMQVVVPLHFPNNVDSKKSQNQNPSALGGNLNGGAGGVPGSSGGGGTSGSGSGGGTGSGSGGSGLGGGGNGP